MQTTPMVLAQESDLGVLGTAYENDENPYTEIGFRGIIYTPITKNQMEKSCKSK